MKRWEVRLLAIAVALIASSGIVYGVMKYLMAGRDPDSRLGHPWQPDVLKVHVLAAPLLVFCLGGIFRAHVLAQLRRGDREGRRSGLLLVGLGVPLLFSGYVVQALTGETARQWTGWLHTGLGLVFTLGYLLHPRRRAAADEAEAPSGAIIGSGPERG